LKKNSEDTQIMYDLASNLLDAKQELKRARNLARAVLEKEFGCKNMITAMHLLARILFQRRKYTEAKSYF